MAEVSNLIQEVPTPMSKAEEDNRIKNLVNTPALDWKQPCPNGFRKSVRGHGYGDAQKTPRQSYVWRRSAVHISNVTSSKSIPEVLPIMNKADEDNKIKRQADIGGRNLVLQQNRVPPGYVCHRCNVPGHLIKYCPTNDDPNYDIKRVAPPRSMPIAASDGSYVVPLPYEGAMMQMMNYYGLGHFHVTMPFGNVMPQFPFGGLNNYMFPVLLPPRDITKNREVNSSGDISSKNCIAPSSSPDQSSGNLQPSRPSKRKSEHCSDGDRSSDHRHHHRSKSLTKPSAKSSSATTKAAATTERRHKADDFSGGSIRERQVSKKRKLTTSCLTEPGRKLTTSRTTHHKAIPARGGGEEKSTIDYRSSDDERHYKRRLPKASWEEERRHKQKRRYY